MAAPRRIDHRRRRRISRDEDAREVEQQGGVLVGAGVEALQRDQEIAPAKIRIADQVERGIGGNEAASGECAGQMSLAQARMMRSISASGTAAGCALPQAEASDGAAGTRRAMPPAARRWRASQEFLIARGDQGSPAVHEVATDRAIAASPRATAAAAAADWRSPSCRNCAYAHRRRRPRNSGSQRS